MLNTVYRLVEPRRFEAQFTDIDISKDAVLVRPTHLSICHADQRYYQGTRSKEILAQKLPMALIHEAIGQVEYDPEGEFEAGTYVVMVPNTPYETDPYIGENYLRSSKFRGSGFDGFMQDYVAMRRDRLVVLPEGINLNVAAFTEIVSVSYQQIPDGLTFDHAFECVGNAASGNAINQIIDYIKPEGTISILGVSENPVPINTRMVLEKGLRIFGSSRSSSEDFKGTIELYRKNRDIQEYFERLICDVIPVRTIADMNSAFDSDIRKPGGKTIMIWEK